MDSPSLDQELYYTTAVFNLVKTKSNMLGSIQGWVLLTVNSTNISHFLICRKTLEKEMTMRKNAEASVDHLVRFFLRDFLNAITLESFALKCALGT